MKQGTYYLTEDEHRDFKAKCAADGVSMTDKMKDLIKTYTSGNKQPNKETEDNNNF